MDFEGLIVHTTDYSKKEMDRLYENLITAMNELDAAIENGTLFEDTNFKTLMHQHQP